MPGPLARPNLPARSRTIGRRVVGEHSPKLLRGDAGLEAIRLASDGTGAALCGMSLPPPRVLLVMPDHWPRALLRAALREAGYDALGAPGLTGALRYRAEVPDRGPVRVIVVDQAALSDREAVLQLDDLNRRHADPALVLLARAGASRAPAASAPAAGWRRIVPRPASIADLVSTVEAVMPLAPGSARPLD
jgi:hypothetical protein